MRATTRVRAVLLAAMAPGAAVSCGDRVDAGPDPVVVRDSAGIEIVESLGPTWGPEEAWTVAAEPVVVIGTVEGDDPYQLARVTGAVRLSDGRIAVLDGESDELRLFDPDGVHLATLGGPGEGPGEFGYPGSLERLEGDTLLYRGLDPVVAIPFDLSRADTLGGLLGLESYALQRAGRREFVIHSLYSRGVAALDSRAGRLFLGETGRYDIRVWSLDGRFERIIRRPGVARATPEEAVEAGYEQAARFLRGEADAAILRGRIHVPDSMPPVSSLTVDSEGHLWVGLRAQESGGLPRYEVFDPEGRLLGRVEVATGVPQDIGEDYLLGLRYDELGVPYVELFGLRRGGG